MSEELPDLAAECEPIMPCVTLGICRATHVRQNGRTTLAMVLHAEGCTNRIEQLRPDLIESALAFAEPWTLPDAPLFLPKNTERVGVSEMPRDGASRAQRGAR